jgi:hypothetical protein
VVPIPSGAEDGAVEGDGVADVGGGQGESAGEARGWGSALLSALQWRRQRPPLIDPTQRWALHYDVPREQYGQLRPSRTMIIDHYLPSYSHSINTVIRALLAQQ